MKKLGLLLAAALVLFGLTWIVLQQQRATVTGTAWLSPGRPAAGYVVHAQVLPRGESEGLRVIPLVLPWRWTATTDRNGRFVIRGVRTDGMFHIGVELPGTGVVSTQGAELQAGETTDVDLIVPRRAVDRSK